MKKLSDFAGDINKCSKCGKCQEVCPVYKLTGNDCTVSRGKFVMLQGVLRGKLKLNKTIEKYLDLCIKCGKCNEYCPSGIDVCEIFNTAKYEYVKDKLYGKLTRFVQSRSFFDKILSLGKVFKRPVCKNKGAIKLLYFKGCVNTLYPKTENAMKRILSYYDVELTEKDFECCGVPFLSSGNLERYEEVKKHNLELLQGNYHYVITDCASCESALIKYFNPLDYAGSLQKIINICHFLAIQNKKFIFKKHLKVTFHKPCHLKSDAFLKPLLAKCQNIEYIEAKDYSECCGFAGEFALHNPLLSLKMSSRKAENLADTGADIILTACPACIIGIHQGFFGKKHPKILNFIEFLDLANEIM